MPDIRDKNTVNAIAKEYNANGRNKTQALVKAGYSKSYATGLKGMQLYDKQVLIDAINADQAKIDAKTTYTITVAQARLDEAYAIAKQQNNPAGMVSSVIASNRMYGFDKDNDMGADQAQELTQSQAEEARRIANIRLSAVKNEDKAETG